MRKALRAGWQATRVSQGAAHRNASRQPRTGRMGMPRPGPCCSNWDPLVGMGPYCSGWARLVRIVPAGLVRFVLFRLGSSGSYLGPTAWPAGFADRVAPRRPRPREVTGPAVGAPEE